MLRRVLLLLSLGGSAFPALAQQPLPHQEDTVQETQGGEQKSSPAQQDKTSVQGAPASPTAKKKSKRKKPKDKSADTFSFNLSLTQMGVFKGGESSISAAGFGGSYQLNKNNKFGFNQGFTKYYEVDEEESEVSAGDTLLTYSHSFGTEAINSSVRFDLTLPVSDYSKRMGVYTKPTLRFLLGKSFFGGGLNLSMGPMVRYFVNEYKTAPADEVSGGELLPRIEYGSDVGITVSGFSILSAGISGSYNKLEYENSKYTNSDTLQNSPVPDYHYSIGFFASAQFNPHMSLTAGMEQANEVNRYGGIEYVIFDQEVTQWYVSLGFNF